MKRLSICLILMVCIGLLLVSCNNMEAIIPDGELDYSNLVQMNYIEGDGVTALMITDLGEVRLVLYPDLAPNFANNFITLAKEGYYDGQSVFQIEEGIALLAGSHLEDGSEGKTVSGEMMEMEITPKLHPFSGALMTVTLEDGTSDSRYLILGSCPLDESILENMLEQGYPEVLVEYYREHGGFPHVYGYYTVYGQVVEGLDVIDAIIEAGSVDDPDTIYVQSIEIIEN